jgi:hypothetical protein
MSIRWMRFGADTREAVRPEGCRAPPSSPMSSFQRLGGLVAAGFAVLGVVATVSAVVAQSAAGPAPSVSPTRRVPNAADARRIRELTARLESLRDERLGIEAAHRESLTKIGAQIDRLVQDRRRAEQAAAAARASLDALEREVTEIRAAADRDALIVDSLRGRALPSIDVLRDRVVRGIPYRRSERSEELDVAARLLGGPSIGERVRGLRGLSSFLDGELRLAGTRELWNAPARVSQTVVLDAYHLRFGLVGQAWVTELDSIVGVPALEPSAEFRIEQDTERAASIRRILAILRRKTAASVEPFPFVFVPGFSARAVSK